MNLQHTFTELHNQGLTHRQIADELNRQGVPSTSGGEWTRDGARNYWRRHVNTEQSDRRDGSELSRSDVVCRGADSGDRFYMRNPSNFIEVGYYPYLETSASDTVTCPIRDKVDVSATLELTGRGTALIVPDIHEPFSIDGFAEWCTEVRDRWGCDSTVFIGDVVDNYATSLHGKDPDNPNATAEFERTAERLDKWFTMFPEAVLTLGNHDDRPMRTAKAGGVSSVFMKSFRETWGIPDGWQICQEAMIDGVLYVHQGGGGRNPSLARALVELVPVVSGHYHTCGGVSYHSGRNHTLWGLDVGCGVDRTGYGLAYNKSLRGYVLGCGVVVNDNGVMIPHFIPYTR